MSDETPDTRLTRRHALALGGAALGGVAIGNNVLAQADDGEDGEGDGDGEMQQYRVTVANLTRGQPLTPPAVVLHSPEIELFSVGDQANEAVQALAENGNLGPLVSLATGGGGGRTEASVGTGRRSSVGGAGRGGAGAVSRRSRRRP